MNKDDRDLDQLFMAYRDACGIPEASADFMPGIWRRVDARRKSTRVLRRWTGAFITAAAALCILMLVYMAVPIREDSFDAITYVDTFEEEAYETLAYSEFGIAQPEEAPDIQSKSLPSCYTWPRCFSAAS